MKILRSLFLVIFLSACQSSWLSDLVTQAGQPLYHDDFSDPSSGWIQTTGPNGSLGYASGAYQIQVQSAGYDLWAASGQVYGDVQVEVDATWLAGPLDNRFGLICRFQDPDNFYVFFVTSDGYYAIGKIKAGAAALLGQEMMAYNSSIQPGQATNHLRFDCVGNTLKGSVNGQVLALTSDTDFASGDAGLIVGAFDEGGVEIGFDNFVVIKP